MSVVLTVIVPVNGVEGQLRECLDSLVGQTLPGIEIIAVNDASRDHSDRILDEFANRYDNVRVVTNTDAIGPGRCRNLGVELARGDYVGFVDGDDWVSADYFESAFVTARSTGADVVVLDHVRAFPTGKLEANRTISALREAPRGAFRIVDHPALLNNIPTVWNKVFRRDFIARDEFRFDAGWYEDIPVTVLSLVRANAIAIARAGTYYYRQRPSSILFSTDDAGHLAVVDRYRQILDDLDALDVESTIRAEVFAYSIWHLRLVEQRGLRRFTPGGLERLRAATATYLVDHGALFNPGLVGLAEATWFRAMVSPEPPRSSQLLDAARRVRRFQKRKQTSIQKRYRAEKIKRKREFYYGRATTDPIDERLVVFASYWYTSPAGNPLAIFEELTKRAPWARCVWVLDGKSDPMGMHPHSFVRQGSPEYYDVLGRAKYLVNNVNFPGFVNKRPGRIELQTTHGTPLKVMGIHESRAPVSKLDINGMLRRSARWDFCLSANPYSSEIWQGAYPTGFELLETGYPRNDILHRYSEHDVRAVRQRLGIGLDETVILYAPTYRDSGGKRVSPTIDFDRLAGAAGPGTTLVNRSHYFISGRNAAGSVVEASTYPITNELLIACDVLLTDYSSIMFDFANLRRPIINYVPDCDEYMRERATYFDIRDKHAGLVATDESTLRQLVADRAWEDESVRVDIDRFSDEFTGFDDGFAAQRVVDRVFHELLTE